jgi:hAT family C-terminal dimerisation region
MENDSFIAAIYLDPRYRTILSKDNVARAKLHIGKTLISIQNASVGSIEIAPEEQTSETSDDDDIDALIKARELDVRNENVMDSGSLHNPNLLSEFEKYEQLGRIDKKLNVLEFWNRQRFVLPVIFAVAQIVLGLPTTQVSVERAFSCVKFLLSLQRCQLSSELLEDIVLIRCNSMFDR